MTESADYLILFTLTCLYHAWPHTQPWCLLSATTHTATTLFTKLVFASGFVSLVSLHFKDIKVNSAQVCVQKTNAGICSCSPSMNSFYLYLLHFAQFSGLMRLYILAVTTTAAGSRNYVTFKLSKEIKRFLHT